MAYGPNAARSVRHGPGHIFPSGPPTHSISIYKDSPKKSSLDLFSKLPNKFKKAVQIVETTMKSNQTKLSIIDVDKGGGVGLAKSLIIEERIIIFNPHLVSSPSIE